MGLGSCRCGASLGGGFLLAEVVAVAGDAVAAVRVDAQVLDGELAEVRLADLGAGCCRSCAQACTNHTAPTAARTSAPGAASRILRSAS